MISKMESAGGAADASRGVGRLVAAALAVFAIAASGGCSSKAKHPFGKDVVVWEGADGVLEVYAGDKLVKRFINIKKVSTTIGATDGQPRPVRHGYGVLDENYNMEDDYGEEEVYFEISEYSTSYVFFQNPD